MAHRDPDAVADTHPERARALYRRIIDGHLQHTNVSAYEAAAPYLRKLRALLHRTGGEAEWSSYLAELREKYRRKRRLMEVLDRVERRRILDR